MGPKKASKSTEGEAAAATGTTTFKWEGPNEVLLLTLIQGRYVKPEEYPRLLEAFPGTNIGGIRNRIGTLRTKQRQLYETYGWGAPEGLPVGKTNMATPKGTPKKAAGTPGKRGAADMNGNDGDGGDGDGEMETPSKKPVKKRAKKVAAAKAKAEKAEEEEEEVEEKEYIKMEPEVEYDFDDLVNMNGEL